MIDRLKALPPIVLIALAAILIGSSIALATVMISRGGHVSRTLTEQINVTANQDLVLGTDEMTGTVTYTVSNPGPVPYTVTVSTGCTPELSISADKTNFPLAVGGSEDVVLTVTFIDAGATDGDYTCTFTAA